MRIVIQRVSQASVTIHETIKASIPHGLLILLGIEHEDTPEDVEWLCNKICHLRIFNDEQGIMNLSIEDVQGDILLISQFTLHANTRKGNRPSYIQAARPETAIPLYELFIKRLSELRNKPVYSGSFGADMQVALINDGPVTILMDSKVRG